MRALFLLTLGCAGNDKVGFGSNVVGVDGEDVEESDQEDLRQDYETADIEFRSPDFEVPPFTEITYCYFGTYDGPTVGIVDFQPIHDPTYTHHNLLKAIPATGYEAFADGDMVDCDEVPMHDRLTPLVEAVGVEASYETVNQDWLNLADGDAIKLEGEVRYVMDMHFINSSPDTLLVNAGMNLGVIEESEVERWVGVARFDVGHLEIPPGGEHTEAFSCEWPQDLEVLSLYGHMHDYGSRFAVHSSLYSEPLYAVDEWDPEYHWLPPIVNYGPGELTASVGESFEVSCTWDNTTGESLGFPDEMCNAVAVVAPLNGTLTCLGGSFVP